MRAADEIIQLLSERRSARSPLLAKMEQVRDAYNGDLAVPLPEMDKHEKVSVANLFNQGIDAMAQRVASTSPDVLFPATREGIKASQQAARKKRQAMLGMWEFNEIPSKMSRRSRYYVGYGSSPVVLVPNMKLQVPTWQIRNPLTTFPADTPNPDDVCPEDTIFSYKRQYKWLVRKYPEAMFRLVNKTARKTPDAEYEVIEYQDYDSTTLIATASRDGWNSQQVWEPLEFTVHNLGMSTAVVLGRATLDRIMGQFEQMLGMYELQAKMHALETIAIQRGIFPNEWVVARPNEMPSIVTQANGQLGEMGVLKGGDIQVPNVQPTYLANQMSDRLERYQRVSGGIPAEFSGESSTNVRTGKRGDSIMSATVDFRIQEAQRDFARSLEAEDRVAIALAKRFWGAQKVSVYVNWPKAKGRVEYVPNDLFDSDEHTVSYAHAGADANGLTIAVGQMTNLGLMSLRTAQSIHPLIEDPEKEHDNVIAERLEQALLASVQQQASAGSIPPSDLARIMQLVRDDKQELAEAVMTAQKEAQARQASQVPQGAPEAQPGLAQPGAGAEAGSAPQPQDLSSLLSALRGPSKTVPAERSVYA